MRRSCCLGLALCLLAGCRTSPPPAPKSIEQVRATPVSVYFPDQHLKHLEAESPDVPAAPGDNEALVRGAVQKLLAGPTEKAHTTVIPKATQLNTVKVTGDTATVDLSKSFVSGFKGGSNVASLAVYSLVNTVTAVPGVSKVQILLDGQPGGEIGGALDLSRPLTADPGLNGSEKL